MNGEILSILEAIKLHAKETPDKLCVGDKKKSATYREFWNMIQRAATYFKNSGIKKDSIVVIRGVQKVEYLVAALGIQLTGAAYLPLEKAVKDDRIIEIMNFVEADVYVAEKPVNNENVKNISLKELLKIVTDKTSPIETFEMPKSNQLAEILFTTGTTGKSKGIEVTFKTDIAIAQNVIDSVEMGKDEVELLSTPINHSLAIRRFYGAMYNESTAILTDGFVFVEDFFKLLDNYKITAITFVPAILDMVLKFAKDRFATYDSQFNYIQMGSAPLSEADKELLTKMFPTVRLYNTYGATESGCTVILEFNKYADKKNCIGRTTVNTTIFFVDENRNEIEASFENPGYMAFKGDMNMRGYYKEPEITKEALENGNIYTNDLGYVGEDGLVYLLGRKGDVINMGGLKIAPTEIEEVVMTYEKIKDCACIPIKDEITGEAPKLFVVMNDGCEFDRKEITKFMLNKLEAFKVPKVFEVIDEIPRTFNGKIIRKKLKELDLQ